MEREQAARASLAVPGNPARIQNLMRRASAGEDLHIGFLGGSITQGSLASKPDLCYAAQVFSWWERTFPKSRFSYINAGIGGTTSLYGAARAWMDLLRYRPDFVVVDFSVNDEATPFFQETFEGVVRQLYRAGAAVLILNNVCYDTGENAQDYHNQVARHYQIPAVSMREGLYAMILDGTVDASSVTPDNLHPNDRGHGLLAYRITWNLERMWEQARQDGAGDLQPTGHGQNGAGDLQPTGHGQNGAGDLQPAEHGQNGAGDLLLAGHGQEDLCAPAPLTANRFEAARRYQIDNCDPRLEGFLTDPRERLGLLDLYKNGWTAGKKGDRFSLTLECSHLSVQYLRAVQKPRPIVEAVVDGDHAHAVTLDGNFDEDWGDCLALTEVYDGAWGRHEIVLTVREAPENAAGPFYLVSLITDGRHGAIAE